MSRAERNASNVRVPKKASRMMRNAQASETMSSVRATEQFRSPPSGLAARCGRTAAATGRGPILAVAERAITLVFGLRDLAVRRGARESSLFSLFGHGVPVSARAILHQPD